MQKYLFYTAILVSLLNLSCSKKKDKESGRVINGKFIKINDSQAYFEEKDFKDQFLFGSSILDVKGLPVRMMTFKLNTQIVRIKKGKSRGGKKKIQILSQSELGKKKVWLSFDYEKSEGFKVNLESLENDLIIKSWVDSQSKRKLNSKKNKRWKSKGKPKVIKIIQDPDTIIGDLKYKLESIGEKDEGEMTFRIFLKRRSIEKGPKRLTSVDEALDKGFGIFGASDQYFKNPVPKSQRPLRIYSTKKTIVFYLKDFPEDMIPVGKKAILSWNKAFVGSPFENIISVELAQGDMDLGHPNGNVVKWIDNSDESWKFAGMAVSIFHDPNTGKVFSGNALINGKFLTNLYQKIHQFTQETQDFQVGLGEIEFSMNASEIPSLPITTGPVKDFKEYMKGFYFRTITHEVGHLLGLRHNFRGSLMKEDGNFISIMDYLPRKERAQEQSIGNYDIAAIKFAYLNELSDKDFPFCLDKDVYKYWDCNKSDVDNPIKYTLENIERTFELLQSFKGEIKHGPIVEPIGRLIFNGLKMYSMKNQIEDGEIKKKISSKKFKSIIDLPCSSTPKAELGQEEKDIVEQNLSLVREKVRFELNRFKKGINLERVRRALNVLTCL